VALNVGFYYMANAMGRLMGTVLSGALFQWKGLPGCLWASLVFSVVAMMISLRLPKQEGSSLKTPVPSAAS
ncbi:MAG: MFS transporter, partial [Verrucomicrobiota bacterium]